MADLMLKTDKGTFNAFGGPNINCVAIPYGKSTIYIHAENGGIKASKEPPGGAPEVSEPEAPQEPERPADPENAAVEGEESA